MPRASSISRGRSGDSAAPRARATPSAADGESSLRAEVAALRAEAAAARVAAAVSRTPLTYKVSSRRRANCCLTCCALCGCPCCAVCLYEGCCTFSTLLVWVFIVFAGTATAAVSAQNNAWDGKLIAAQCAVEIGFSSMFDERKLQGCIVQKLLMSSLHNWWLPFLVLLPIIYAVMVTTGNNCIKEESTETIIVKDDA